MMKMVIRMENGYLCHLIIWNQVKVLKLDSIKMIKKLEDGMLYEIII